MQYVVTKTTNLSLQLAIEAEDPDAAEAQAKAGKGNAIARNSSEQYQVTPRQSARPDAGQARLSQPPARP
jgi:hypothetical protein